MSISDILYSIFIGPLEVLFEIIFSVPYELTENPAVAIFFLSLIMNLLLLPMYNRTDAIQLEAIDTEKRLRRWSQHIKKTFQGDERFMILQTYYRQNHYRQTDVLKGISPLLLEVPFFMAAYHFLSHLEPLAGAYLGPIESLGLPDALLHVGTFSINVLPILMTVINLISGAIYTRGAALQTKLQLYGMAAVFLVLLYDSPSGLVLYWTLNNLFSLVKNIIVRRKHPRLITGILLSILGIASGVGLWLTVEELTTWGIVGIVSLVLIMSLPLISCLFHRRKEKIQKIPSPAGKKAFYFACLLLTGVLGLLIPSALLRSSPDEFLVSRYSPLWYVGHSAFLAAGTFLVWLVVFHHLMKPSWQRKLEAGTVILCGVVLIDFMFFGQNYGNMGRDLVFDDKMTLQLAELLKNAGVLLAAGGILYGLFRWKPGFVGTVCLAGALAVGVMSAQNMVQSKNVVEAPLAAMKEESREISYDPVIHLSKDGKNVVVLMIDRGMAAYVPYIMEEKPELREQFSGFTYYPNTLSYGGHTNFGLPAVMGGYEYTPLEMNKRDDILLKNKHNEAMKVMPVMFLQEGYDVTVCDPTYANYRWSLDTSIYKDYPQIETHILEGNYNPNRVEYSQKLQEQLDRNFYFYSIFRACPTALQEYMYNEGKYLKPEGYNGQTLVSNLRAQGTRQTYANARTTLQALPKITEVTEGENNTFFMMCNNTAHEIVLLQMPDYTMENAVDNTGMDLPNPERTDGQGNTIVLRNTTQTTHYHVNMSAFLELGKWMDYLKENGVYDNTRIILVADHGFSTKQYPDKVLGDRYYDDILLYNPLLMVKDFNSDSFKTDERLMTNADTPLLASDGLISHPVNPFTGTGLEQAVDKDENIFVSASHEFNIHKNNGTRYKPDEWLMVHGDVREKENWSPFLDQDTAMNMAKTAN